MSEEESIVLFLIIYNDAMLNITFFTCDKDGITHGEKIKR
jgi:hypothetical protein